MNKNFDGRLFGFVQFQIQIPQHLRRYFSNSLPKFKNTLVSRENFGTLMKKHAEKGNIKV